MLQKVLDKVEEEIAVQLKAVNDLPEGVDKRFALRDVQANGVRLRRYVDDIYSRGYELTEDLGRVEALYRSDEMYRLFFNHVSSHLIRLRRVVEKVRAGTFEPEFSSSVEIDEWVEAKGNETAQKTLGI